MKLASNLGQLSNRSLHNPNLEQYRKKNPFQKEKVEKNTDQVQKPFDQELKSVAQEFESLFTHHMLKQMRSFLLRVKESVLLGVVCISYM